MAQFKNDTKIKLSIDEFLTKNLSKYYQDVEIKMQQLTDIPNLWMRFNNAFAREKANNLTNKDFIDFQNKFFNLHLNNYFIDSINNSEKDDFKKLSNENVVNILAQYFNDYFQKSKHKIDYRIGFEVEDLVALCQLLIFQKLINNTLYDDIKKVNKSNIVDLDYLNSEFGKLRSAINALDMSKFEIINKKDPPRKVETLKDKIFAIRLLRNSISHDGFAYQLSNTKEIFDTYLRLYSYENPHLSLRVRIKHLLELLNNNFFKYLEDKPVEKKELPTVEELENIAKLKCNTEEEDED